MQEEAGLAETGRVLSVGYVGIFKSEAEKGRTEELTYVLGIVMVLLEYMG